MEAQRCFIFWLQLFSAYLVFAVRGRSLLCLFFPVCGQLKSPPLMSSSVVVSDEWWTLLSNVLSLWLPSPFLNELVKLVYASVCHLLPVRGMWRVSVWERRWSCTSSTDHWTVWKTGGTKGRLWLSFMSQSLHVRDWMKLQTFIWTQIFCALYFQALLKVFYQNLITESAPHGYSVHWPPFF